MRRNNKSNLIGVGVFFLLCAGLLQRLAIYPTWTRDYNKSRTQINTSLDPQQMMFALAGFREMLAGILWVRADAFFDTGNYDAILPIIRLVTLLDPQQIDVYATGMWHIGYNFTDEEQRSDRRYIPSALALGKEGCRQNPETYEMFFETGWMWYHKIDDDYPEAVKYFIEAQQRPDMIPARKNLLMMAYQRNFQIDDALNMGFKLYDDALKRVEEDGASGNKQNRDTLENNIDTMLVRMVQRGYVAEKAGRSTAKYDISPPFDVGFSAKVTVLEPMVLRVEGTWNVRPVGTRVRIVLRDKDYTVVDHGVTKNIGRPAGMDWDFSNDVNLDPPRDKTFMQDQLFVKNTRFNKKIDMSKDPPMYPFTSDKYLIEFYYNPRSAPPHIQDKFGWNGEGMTDKHFLNDKVRPGQKCIYYAMEVPRDAILLHGQYQDKHPVFKTPNYVETKQDYNQDQILLDIPSLRASGK